MEGLECEVHVDEVRLEHVSELKYLECVLDKSGTDEAECSRKMASRRKVAGTVKSLINARDLQLERATVLHQTSRRDLDLGCTGGQPQRIARY